MTPSPTFFPARTVLARAAVSLPAAALAALLAFAVPGLAQSPAADPVVAKVNGVEVRQSDLAIAEEDVGSNIPAGTAESRRDWLVNYVADMLLLAKAPEAAKLADSEDGKKRLAYARDKALMETLLRSVGKTAATDAAMKQVYEEAIKQASDEQEVSARHILFRAGEGTDGKAAEEKAKATLARVKKGEDFATLAKELTEDPPGKADGGDLGWFTKDQMVPEFSDVAFKMEKGQISDPVKTAFGWHIIKVEDKRKRQPPSFDQVKEQIENFVTRKAQIELVTKLRNDAKIERLDGGTAPSAAPAPKN